MRDRFRYIENGRMREREREREREERGEEIDRWVTSSE